MVLPLAKESERVAIVFVLPLAKGESEGVAFVFVLPFARESEGVAFVFVLPLAKGELEGVARRFFDGSSTLLRSPRHLATKRRRFGIGKLLASLLGPFFPL